MACFVALLFAVLLSAHAASDSSSDSNSSECDDDSSSSSGGRGRGGNGRHRHHHGGGSSNSGCGTGWKSFSRPNGVWCLRVYSGANIDYADAVSNCVNHDAVLSGIQDATEMAYIAQTASSNLASSTGSLWIGAQRTSACLQSKLTSTCSKTTSFYWTDSSTSGTAGFSWLDASQPDNALGGNQNCASFFFASANTVVNNVNWFPGALDDVNCVASALSSIPARTIQGYLCGKSPSS
ncbi:unnamed protein product [Caenorhabditis sp. 36 PRJEB53466]|nr:unnamed protein product [Caenorhabditis sp. 36 PRJEB53466]